MLRSRPAPDTKDKKPRSARPRDAAATKATILECAVREFAERGYDGARIERIVDAAGVNVSLAYQYFGSKEQMFIAVMEHIYGLMRTHHHDIEVRGLDPLAAMERLVRNTFRIFVKHPEIIGLLNSENVHRGKHIAKSPYIQKLYNPLLDTIDEVLRSGIDKEVFAPTARRRTCSSRSTAWGTSCCRTSTRCRSSWAATCRRRRR